MADKIEECECKEFPVIDEFYSIQHFKQFEKWINNLAVEGKIYEVPVGEPFSIVNFKERWFKCHCGTLWRLVTPDFPFKGLFKPVEKGTLHSVDEA